MPDTDSNESKKRWAIHDARAVMAIFGRLIAGGILALMFAQYFSSQEAGTAFVKSRIWWEIVLNLQLLGAGLIWFSYSDRVTPEPGRLRTLQLLRKWLSIFAIFTPTLIGLIAVFYDWFAVLPGAGVLIAIATFTTIHLCVNLYVYRQIEQYRVNPKHIYSPRERLVFYAPSILFIAFAFIDVLNGGNTWFILMPMMSFSQGAMPYVFEALGLKAVENYA